MSERIVAIVLVSVLGACDGSSPFTEIPEDTFWSTTDPAGAQMDEEKIAELEALLAASEHLYAFLVIRNGRIVSETYRNGANERTLLHLRSITKHVTGLLAGMAVEAGSIDSTEVYLSDYFDEIPSGSAWNGVTLYHLLNMISGMAWSEVRELPTFEAHADDPLPFVFSRDIVHAPGTTWTYNSPGVHLVSHLIQRVSGSTTEAFAAEHLFDPLGVKGYRWPEDGQGVVQGHAGLELTARDLAKIGLLHLRNGTWNGRQLVSKHWIEDTWNNPLTNGEVTGFDRAAAGYRNYWWTTYIRNVRVHYSDGYGGQLLLIVPAYDLIVVTHRSYRVDERGNRAAFSDLFDVLIPRVLESIRG